MAVVEKGKACGAHTLSGANMVPSAMKELFPDLDPARGDWEPFAYQEVTKDAVYLLTKKAALPVKPMPPNFRNHGNYVISVAKLSRFSPTRQRRRAPTSSPRRSPTSCSSKTGSFAAFARATVGRGKDGRVGNFQPGSDVVAKATVLAEGTLGHLTEATLDYYELHGSLPVRWELGVKEVWEVSKPLDRVIHTMGWPLRKASKWNEFRQQLIYPMGEDKLCIGLVVGLDYTDSTLSVHDALQELKTHPFVKDMLEGGKRVAWGAKTIPSGGYYSMPRSLSVPGLAIAGDAASMVNVPTLKGVHYAMQAGMYAAEAIVDALKKDSINLGAYDEKVRKSAIERDLFDSRNMRAPFSKGFFVGGAIASAMTITKGLIPGGMWDYEPDTEIEMADGGASESYPKPDNELTFNKLDSVFLSGNATRDDAPNHVRVQTRVPRELAKTWVALCPARSTRSPTTSSRGFRPTSTAM